MEYNKLGWEEVSKFEEIKGYGQPIWRHHEKYFLLQMKGEQLNRGQSMNYHQNYFNHPTKFF